jgi:hypothetical protein
MRGAKPMFVGDTAPNGITKAAIREAITGAVYVESEVADRAFT